MGDGCDECAGHRVEMVPTKVFDGKPWRWVIDRGGVPIAYGFGRATQEAASADLDDLLMAAHSVAIDRGLFDEAGQYIGPTTVANAG